MRSYFQTIRQFRLKSVFFRTYFLFALVTVLFTGIFCLYIYQVYNRNYANEQNQAMEAFLRQTEERVDESLKILTQSVRSLSQQSEIVQMVILPKKDTTALDFQITSLLEKAVNTSGYFERIILYESTTGNILQTSDRSEERGAEGLTPLVSYCLDEKNWHLTEEIDHRNRSGLVIYGNEVYLAEHFITGSLQGAEFLGTLLVRLSWESLFGDLSRMLSDSPYYLKIQSPDERTLFLYEDPEADDRASSSIEQTSSYSGWNFLLSKSGVLGLAPMRFARTVFPFLLFFLLIGFLFSFFLAVRIYQPLHRMVLTFSDIPGREPPYLPLPADAGTEESRFGAKPESEYDLLTHIHRQTRTDRQTAEEFISLAVPEFERNILMQIIAEDLTDPEVLEYQLRYIRSSLQMDGSFQCFLVYSDHSAESSHVVDLILQNQAGALAEQTFRQEWGQLRVLRLDSTALLLVVQYAPDLSAARIRRYQDQFSSALTPRLSGLDEHLLFAAGSICSSLPAIHQSYYKAREIIREKLYYQADEPVSQETSAPGEAPGMKDQYFRSQMKLLEEQIRSGSFSQARNLTAALLREVCFSDDGMDTARSRCSDLFNVLIPQALQPETGTSPAAGVYQELETITDSQELYGFMVRESGQLIDKAEVLKSNRQYQTVARAKDYIQQHYSDSALSLQQIADSIGVSSTYLSTLFAEYAGDTLVSYLNNYRVEAAKDLLTNTRIIIKEVGYQTGFNTVQNFNRVFKKATGITPGDYRKQCSSL